MKRNIILVLTLCLVAYVGIIAYYNSIYGHYNFAVVTDKGVHIGEVEVDVSFEYLPKYHWLDQRIAFKKTIICTISIPLEDYRAYNGKHMLSGYSAGYINRGFFFSGEGDIAIRFDNSDGWQMGFGEFFRDRFTLK